MPCPPPPPPPPTEMWCGGGVTHVIRFARPPPLRLCAGREGTPLPLGRRPRIAPPGGPPFAPASGGERRALPPCAPPLPPAQFRVDFSRVRGRGQGVPRNDFTSIRLVQSKQNTALVCPNAWVGLIRSGGMGHQVRTNLSFTPPAACPQARPIGGLLPRARHRGLRLLHVPLGRRRRSVSGGTARHPSPRAQSCPRPRPPGGGPWGRGCGRGLGHGANERAAGRGRGGRGGRGAREGGGHKGGRWGGGGGGWRTRRRRGGGTRAPVDGLAAGP